MLLSRRQRPRQRSPQGENVINLSDRTLTEPETGGAVVLMNKSSYRAEMLRQLSNSVFYTPLKADPTVKFPEEIQVFLKRALEDQLI